MVFGDSCGKKPLRGFCRLRLQPATLAKIALRAILFMLCKCCENAVRIL